MADGNKTILGRANATFTPVDDTRRVPVKASICDKQVPPAAQSILGRCEYYYRPLHNEYVDKTGVSTWAAVKAWATRWNPWDDAVVAERLLRKKDKLIQASSTDDDWSRHASFMMRHVGCGHVPPDYYVSYGYYYCSIYGEKLYPRLSRKGKDWLDNARKLLQRNMEVGLKQNMKASTIRISCKRFPNRTAILSASVRQLETDPAAFKTFAFKTHVPAYLDAGLADLPPLDLMRIGGQPNLEEWLDRDTWDQAIESGAEVGRHKAGRALDAAGNAVREGGEAIREGTRWASDVVQGALDSLTRKFQ